jgi:tetratricopeptide (TPR) repeat protein
MLSAEERYRLLEEASELSRRWDYEGLKAYGSRLSGLDLYTDPELSYLYALALYRCGDYDATWPILQELDRICQNNGKDRLHCRRVSLKGALHVERGELHLAEMYFSEALFIAAAKDYKQQVATAMMNLGVISSIRCEWDEAIASFERAIVANQQIGDMYNLASAHYDLGMTYREVGNYSEASAQLDLASAFFRQHASTLDIAYSSFERALVMKSTGDLDLAETTIRHAIATLPAPRPMRCEAEGLRALAIVLIDTGEIAMARAHLARALDLAAATGAQMLKAEVHEELAVINHSLGDHGFAETHVTSASTIYQMMGADIRVQRMRKRLERHVQSQSPDTSRTLRR